MTINELKQLDDKYGSDAQALSDMCDLIILKHTLSFENRVSDETISFWSRILDNIHDDYVKELVYDVFSEYIFYRERDHFDVEEWNELTQAYLDDRLFIFPFKPGDFIQKRYSDCPEKITSISMNSAYAYPVINTESRYVKKHVAIVQNTIDYDDLDQYEKVNNVKTHGLYDEYGEMDDYYFD